MDQPIETVETVEPASDTVSRVTFNYVVIAITFLLLGVILGAVGYDRFTQSNAALVEQSVIRALSSAAGQDAISGSIIAALESGSGDTARLNPNERYEILTGDNPAFGPEDAPVTIIEFSDFRCGFCGRFAQQTLQPLLTEYEGRVRFVYRDYIIFGQPSYEAALASECADDQGKFWEYHNLVFANQQNISPETLMSFGEELELDMDTFQSCFDDEVHRDAIAADVSYGQSLGLSGTPSFFINGRFVSGAQPIEVFRAIIDEELQAAA